MIMKPNYYTSNQLERLNKIETEILRTSLEECLEKYNI